MFEFCIVAFVVYVMYKLATGTLKIVRAIMALLVYVVLFCTAIIATIVKMLVKLYAKALSVNPIMTIGSTCAAYAGYLVMSH